MGTDVSSLEPHGLKPAKTYAEQILLLKSRGLVILDDAKAEEILKNLNYYRFSAYLLTFRIGATEAFAPGIKMEKVQTIYEFDRRLRNLIMAAIEPVEIRLRTRIAYYHSHKYGEAGYESSENFESVERHAAFLDLFRDAVNRNDRALIVQHHKNHYGGRFPLWVAVELFSFGMLSKFYANMKIEDRRQVARELGHGAPHLKSWMVCLSYLRNLCAHYSRLYDIHPTNLPRLPNGTLNASTNRVFDIIYVMKYLYPDATTWNRDLVAPLRALVDEYCEHIDLQCIGFPKRWHTLLNP